MAKNAMVDLETWDLIPGADLRSIGAVIFDIETGEFIDEFYVAIKTPWYLIKRWWWPFGKLTRSADTIKWWAQQSEEAQNAFTNPVSFGEALGMLDDWWRKHESYDYTRFWAHGPHFDEQLLAAGFRLVKAKKRWGKDYLKAPWLYRAPRDLRTYLEAAGMDPKTGIPSFGTAHNALDDAKAQALAVVEAHRRLTAPRLAEAA